MQRPVFICILFLGVATVALAQSDTRFIEKGKIEFERKTNQHAYLQENNVWDEMMKKSLPQFITYYFDLTFIQNKTLYTTGRQPETRQNRHWAMVDVDNVIATDMGSQLTVTQKDIFGSFYLISDSVRKIDWKIGSEIRKIAGFDCRKAVGRIMDSIVVIAFYTDEILCTGGPESFAGLPGMILGVAIPRMHTTWYATKIQLTEVGEKDIVKPARGKKMDRATFEAQLGETLKQLGERGTKMQWQFLL